jgi:hypothetical protein
MKKTDANLREDISVFDMLGEYGGWLVVAGVVAEVVYAILYREGKSFWQAFTPAIASGLVAFGVIVEIFSARKAADARDELVTRSNNKLAEALDRVADVEFANGFIEEKLEMATNDLAKANRGLAEAIERAANAELVTERLRSQMAARALTREQYEAFQELRGKLADVNIMFGREAEMFAFAMQIFTALNAAGVRVRLLETPEGMISPIGLQFWLPSNEFDLGNAHPLVAAFEKGGMKTGIVAPIESVSFAVPRDIPTVWVGAKELNWNALPYLGGTQP